MSPTILIIEDDLSLVEGLTFILEEEGYRITTESSGEKITPARILHMNPSTILLDYILPDENGLQVALRIKQNPKTRHIPIIMMSATKSIMEKAIKESGVDYFLAKPFDIDHLLNLLAQCTRALS